jgi:hypothetical protein
MIVMNERREGFYENLEEGKNIYVGDSIVQEVDIEYDESFDSYVFFDFFPEDIKLHLFGRKEHLGHNHNYRDSEEYIDHWNIGREDLEDECILKRTKGGERHYLIPVFIYEHSCVALSTKSFMGRAHHADWDSGLSGYIEAPVNAIKDIYGIKKLTEKNLEKFLNMVEAYMEEYTEILNGEVYRFEDRVVDKSKLVSHMIDEESVSLDTLSELKTEKELNKIIEDYLEDSGGIKKLPLSIDEDSCGGFVGSDFHKNGLSDHLYGDAREKFGIEELKELIQCRRRESEKDIEVLIDGKKQFPSETIRKKILQESRKSNQNKEKGFDIDPNKNPSHGNGGIKP